MDTLVAVPEYAVSVAAPLDTVYVHCPLTVRVSHTVSSAKMVPGRIAHMMTIMSANSIKCFFILVTSLLRIVYVKNRTNQVLYTELCVSFVVYLKFFSFAFPAL